MSIRARLAELEATANLVVLERQVEIACLINALLSRTHVSIVGTKGIAKTFLTDTLVGLIGGLGPEDYFKAQLGRRSDPADLLGPYTPAALREGRFSRHTAHKLPRARIAHVAEFWKAPDSARDDLLTILNEGWFFNGQAPEDCPLTTMIADSNEMPEGDHPLADRFTFWLVSTPIKGKGNVETMLRGAVDRLHATGTTRRPHVTPMITWAEIEQAQREVAAMPVSDEAITALQTLWSQLADAGINPSPRRLVACLPVMQANAWRSGSGVTSTDDMGILAHVLWTKPSQLPTVQRHIYEVASPLDIEALDLSVLVEELRSSYDALANTPDRDTRKSLALPLHDRATAVGEALLDIKARADAAGRRLDLFVPLSNELADLGRKLLGVMRHGVSPAVQK